MASRGKKTKRQFGDNGFGERGGYMAAKKAKLEEQFSEISKREIESTVIENKKRIFDGVAIFVNGYTGKDFHKVLVMTTTVQGCNPLRIGNCIYQYKFFSEPTADELKRIMIVHGGTFHHYQSSRTTHIIAKNLPDVKVNCLKIKNWPLP